VQHKEIVKANDMNQQGKIYITLSDIDLKKIRAKMAIIKDSVLNYFKFSRKQRVKFSNLW
jgi:hypothetical protein